MENNIINSYNKKIIISSQFKKYRSYLYRIDNLEYFANTYLKIVYVIKGQVNIKVDDKIIKLEQNSLYYIGPNICYTILKDADINTLLVLDIKVDYVKKTLGKDFSNIIYQNEDYVSKQQIISLMGEIYLMTFDEDWNSFLSDKKLENLISVVSDSRNIDYNLYNVASTQDGSVENTIYNITRYLNKTTINDEGLEISLKDISKEYNINYYYLSRHFKEITGQNYTDYLLNIKLNMAVNLLINTDYKIVDISKVSNFTNVKSFNSHFRNTFYTTPTEFRNKYKDLRSVILKDKLHQEKDTKIFFKEILNDDIRYFKSIIIDKYKVDLNRPAIKILDSWDNIIDLNNIMDIDEDFSPIHNIFDREYVSNVILNISVEYEELYLINKNMQKVKINIHQFKYIVDEIYSSGCYFILIFNTNLENDKKLEEIEKIKMMELIDILTGIVGYTGLKNISFGLNIFNIKETLESRGIKIISNIIDSYKEVFTDYLEHNYNWILYLTGIRTKEDIERYIELVSLIKVRKNDKFLLGIDYKHEYIDYYSSISYYIEAVEIFKSSTPYENETLVGFNYNISNIDIDEELTFNYATLFCIHLYLKLKEKGHKIGYINYEKEVNGEKIKLEKFTHNKLNLKTPEYYITSIMKSFANDIVLNENGIIITKDCKDIYIFLYDNVCEIYKYITSNLVVNMNKSIEYKLELIGIEGKYKLTDYTFSLLDRRIDISDEHIINISEEDKKLLDYSNMPRVNIEIKKFKDKDFYNVVRKVFEIKYIKLKKI